jgi:hypothetical protein
MNSWGKMCRISRSIGMATALAASITRLMSLRVISTPPLDTAMTPWLFIDRM